MTRPRFVSAAVAPQLMALMVSTSALIALGAPLGCSKRSEASPAPTCATCVVADERGFTPNSLSLKAGAKGESADVTFTRTSDDTCAREVVFPELNIKQALPLNKPTHIQIPIESAKTIAFQCGMGMYKSAILVR